MVKYGPEGPAQQSVNIVLIESRDDLVQYRPIRGLSPHYQPKVNKMSDSHQQNYQRFIDEVKANRVMWGLRFGDEWVVCDSTEFEDTEVMPVWSTEDEARAQCLEEWADYEPFEISLAEFLEIWVEDLSEDGVRIGPNWDEELDGIEVDVLELVKALA
jgi:hypothetical protein